MLKTFTSASPTSLQPGYDVSLSKTAPVKKSLNETELKVITVDGSPEPFRLLGDDLDKNLVSGWKLLKKSEPMRLISRQFETSDDLFTRHGFTFRMRGNYENEQYTNADINIKTNRGGTEIGMNRGEYEVRIPDTGYIDLSLLEAKYADEIGRGEADDLVKAIGIIRAALDRKTVMEKNLIDNIRLRRVIRTEEGYGGFSANQQFVGEMLDDEVSYLKRSFRKNSTVRMTVPKGKFELEMECLDAACDYNKYAGCDEDVCKNIQFDDKQIALMLFHDIVQDYALRTGHVLETATSKSTRGFEGWKNLRELFAAFAREEADPNHIYAENTVANRPGLILPFSSTPEIIQIENLNIPWKLEAA